MSEETLLSNTRNTTTVNYANTKTIMNNHGLVTVSAYGVGSGTWNATVQIFPVFIYDTKITDTPIVLTINNTATFTTQTVQTPHDTYVASVSVLSGMVSVSAQVEG